MINRHHRKFSEVRSRGIWGMCVDRQTYIQTH